MMNERLANELEVLRSIYGVDDLSIETDPSNDSYVLLKVKSVIGFTIKVNKHRYPEFELPTVVCLSKKYTIDLPFVTGVNEEVLFSYIEKIKEVYYSQNDIASNKAVVNQASKNNNNNDGNNKELNHFNSIENDSSSVVARRFVNHDKRMVEFATSTAIIEKKSKFIAFACRVFSVEEAFDAIAQLSEKRETKNCTHLMWAYKLVSGGVSKADNDDGGEASAGQNISEIIHFMKQENVLVCCVRFYGGIELGSLRFKIIKQTCREAIEKMTA